MQVAAALDRKERLLGQLRSMNDEAEKTGPDGQKMQPSDTFRQAYADVVMQLKQVTPQMPSTWWLMHVSSIPMHTLSCSSSLDTSKNVKTVSIVCVHPADVQHDDADCAYADVVMQLKQVTT